MLTFDKIRDIERQERDSRTLQKLPDGFIGSLADYLARKESVAEKASADILEIENIKATIKRIFEAREKKLLDMALYTARTGTLPENLIESEEKSFDAVLEALRS